MLTLDQAVGLTYVTPMEVPFWKKSTHPLEHAIWGIPLILWGAPGIAKSARINQLMERACLPKIVINPAGYQPEDFTGIPVRQDDGSVRRVCALNQIHEIIQMPEALLFFDEIGLAPRAVQAALLPVFLERRVGDIVLPSKIRLVGAANPPDDTDGEGFSFMPPFANRLLHRFEPILSTAEWASYRLHGPSKDVLDIRDAQEEIWQKWEREYPRANSDIVTFVQRTGQGMLHSLPKCGHEDRGYAWPSPRTWEFATHLLTVTRCLGLPVQDAHELITYAVGKGAADEWLQFHLTMDLPSLQDLLAGKWAPNAQRLDVTMAVLNSLTQSTDEKIVTLTWKLLEQSIEVGLADIARPHASALVNAGFGLKGKKPWVDHAKRVLGALYGEKHV